MFKKMTVLLALGALLAAPAMAADKVKIGFVTTLTTPAAVVGQEMVDAVNLAMEEIGGKMSGLDVELIIEDDGFKPPVGKQKVDKLSQKRQGRFHRWLHLVTCAFGCKKACA